MKPKLTLFMLKNGALLYSSTPKENFNLNVIYNYKSKYNI